MDTMMMAMDSVQQDYNSSSSSSRSNQNCFGLMDALPPYTTNSSNNSTNTSYCNYTYAPNNTSNGATGGGGAAADLMKPSSTNSSYSLIRHHSAPSSVLQGLVNDEDHDLLYKFNPPAPGHGGTDDNHWSSLLDIDSDYTNLIANIDNIVPYPLPSILEQDDTNNGGMISPGPDHVYIISSNDSRNSNSMDTKRRRRRRKPPLPLPSPSSGHELIRHSSSPAHLLSRIAMEEMHEMEMETEMEMEMEMEKKKKKIVPAMNISLLTPATAPATISGNELYSYKNLKQHQQQQQIMRNQMNHPSRSGTGIIMKNSVTDINPSCSAGILSSSSSASSPPPPPPASAYSNSSSPSGHGQIMKLHYNYNGTTPDVMTPPSQPSSSSSSSSSSCLSSPSSSLSSSSSLSPSLLPPSAISPRSNVLIRQSSSPAGLLSQLCLDEHHMSRQQRPVQTDGHQMNSPHLSAASAAIAMDRHHYHHHHHHRSHHRDDLLLSSNSSHPLLKLDRDQVRAGLLSPIEPQTLLHNSASPALAIDQQEFHSFDDCAMDGIHSSSSPDGSGGAGAGAGGSLSNCQARAKRGHATHPRSIAERVRRTKISERIKKLQDLVPNLDKQANTADMLDEVVEYVKLLQWKIQELSLNRSSTVICEECGPTTPAKTTPPR